MNTEEFFEFLRTVVDNLTDDQRKLLALQFEELVKAGFRPDKKPRVVTQSDSS